MADSTLPPRIAAALQVSALDGLGQSGAAVSATDQAAEHEIRLRVPGVCSPAAASGCEQALRLQEIFFFYQREMGAVCQ